MLLWCVALLVQTALANPDVVYQEAFEKFLVQHKASYSDEERPCRFDIFKSNYDFIQAQNAKNGPYQLAVNKFTAMTDEEMFKNYMGARPEPLHGAYHSLGRHNRTTLSDVPAQVDWVAKGAVTPVKNQATCGSCWTFSTTGALEGAWQIASGKLVSLSEQQVLDCSGGGSCSGGLVYKAYEWAEENDLCTQEGYSAYQPKQGPCSKVCSTVGISQGSVVGYKWVDHEVSSLMSAVAQQPVSINVDATGAFTFYHSGILTESCGAYQDHAVLLVGYGTEDGTDYWKIKNSWGEDWGDHGYLRTFRGDGGSASLKFIKLGGFEPEGSDHPEAPGFLEMSYTETGKLMNGKPVFAGYYYHTNTPYYLVWNTTNWVVTSSGNVYACAPKDTDITDENDIVTGWSQWNATGSKWDQLSHAGVEMVGVEKSLCGVLSHPRYPVVKSAEKTLVV